MNRQDNSKKKKINGNILGSMQSMQTIGRIFTWSRVLDIHHGILKYKLYRKDSSYTLKFSICQTNILVRAGKTEKFRNRQTHSPFTCKAPRPTITDASDTAGFLAKQLQKILDVVRARA